MASTVAVAVAIDAAPPASLQLLPSVMVIPFSLAVWPWQSLQGIKEVPASGCGSKRALVAALQSLGKDGSGDVGIHRRDQIHPDGDDAELAVRRSDLNGRSPALRSKSPATRLMPL